MEPGARVLDYGCGIGSDGLALLEAGYEVEFADFDNPSTAYLRWRLARRELSAPIYDLDVEVPGGFDAAYAFDVIEHVDDPFALPRRAGAPRRTSWSSTCSSPGRAEREPASHRELPIPALARHAADERPALVQRPSRPLAPGRLRAGRGHGARAPARAAGDPAARARRRWRARARVRAII